MGLLLQAALVANRRLDLHRRIGWVLAGVAVAVVVTSASITSGVAPAMAKGGFDAPTVAALAPRIFWGNIAAVATFGGFVAAAVWLRRHAQAHKRLMLLASISLIGPALPRIGRWPIFPPEVNAGFFFIAVGASFLLVSAVAVYDFATRGRMHRATLVGGALLIAAKLVAAGVIASSDLGRSMVPGLD